MKKFVFSWLIIFAILLMCPAQAQDYGYGTLDDCISYTTGANATHTFGDEPLTNSYPPAMTRGVEVTYIASSCVTGTGQARIVIPACWDGMSLVAAVAIHDTAGSSAGGDSDSTIDIQKSHSGGAFASMLTGLITITKGGTLSSSVTIKTDGTQVVNTGDILRIDVSTLPASTAPLGLRLVLTFSF